MTGVLRNVLDTAMIIAKNALKAVANVRKVVGRWLLEVLYNNFDMRRGAIRMVTLLPGMNYGLVQN